MKHTLLFIVSIFVTSMLFSQKTTISGYIEDSESGEKIIGATIIDKISKKGTSTNVYGFYSLTLDKGKKVNIVTSFVGFSPQSIEFITNNDTTLEVKLSETTRLKEVEVVAEESEQIQETTEMGTINLSMDKVKSLPVLMGETDIIKTAQLLPGVQSGSEGASGMYVRGGGPDQNLMLLDGVPVYNASHLFGFFSVFNADAINSVKLVKGGFPARYGGRLSSVLDIRMKEGNMNKIHGEGSIGLISSKLTLEGPIKKDKTSFLISGRRTYIDLLAAPIIAATSTGETSGGYFFYDFNAKLNHKINDKHRLFLSTYAGDDKFYFKDKYEYQDFKYEDKGKLRWGNLISALRWNYMINNKLFSNATLTYSRYNFVTSVESSTETTQNNVTEKEEYALAYVSGINDWGGKIDFDWIPNPNHYVKFGIGNTYHTFTPGVNEIDISGNFETFDTTYGSDKQFAHEATAFIEDDFKINDKIKVNVGVHASGFILPSKNYFSVQPRISGRYLLNKKSSIKASFTTMTQYLHLLSNTSIGLPTDLWVPATEKIAPQQAQQFAVGYARSFNKFQFSGELYYKAMQNLIEYKDGASYIFGGSQDWQDKVETGKGWSYGAELLFEKKKGKTTGWIGYTLSWANREFENVNFGEVFPYRYDRRHDISVALVHNLEEKTDSKGRRKWMDIGMVWVYGTGKAITLSTERYTSSNILGGINNQDGGFYGIGSVDNIESRNNFREPSYHRMDFGFNWHKEKKWGERTWSLSFYNLYNRRNPFFLLYTTNYQGNDYGLYALSIFPILPSVTYSFKF